MRLSIAAIVLPLLAACAAQPPQPNVQLAEGWQVHARPLINTGPGTSIGTTAWRVPSLLPRGTYQVVSMQPGGPRLVDGHRFVFDGDPAKQQWLMLSAGYGDVWAVEEPYVAAAKR